MNTPKKTVCVYCGLPSYGRGCRFAPRGIHVHPTADKCMYCGLASIGRGCRFAPHGIHVRFGDFGFIQHENVNSGFILGYILNSLSQPIEVHPAYKLGIVNESGDVIRKPVGDQECCACSPMEMMLINLKKRFGGAIDLTINESLFRSSINSTGSFDPDQYNAEMDFKSAIENVAEQFYNIIEMYSNKLSMEKIDQYITEGFLNDRPSKSSRDR